MHCPRTVVGRKILRYVHSVLHSYITGACSRASTDKPANPLCRLFEIRKKDDSDMAFQRLCVNRIMTSHVSVFCSPIIAKEKDILKIESIYTNDLCVNKSLWSFFTVIKSISNIDVIDLYQVCRIIKTLICKVFNQPRLQFHVPGFVCLSPWCFGFMLYHCISLASKTSTVVFIQAKVLCFEQILFMFKWSHEKVIACIQSYCNILWIANQTPLPKQPQVPGNRTRMPPNFLVAVGERAREGPDTTETV